MLAMSNPDTSLQLTRRQALACAAIPAIPISAPRRPVRGPLLCLNTATLRSARMPLERLLVLAAECGYAAIEPWAHEVDAAVLRLGGPAALRRAAERNGVAIACVIAFPEWAVDDDARRRSGLETARRVAELVAALGCRWMAAPPAGATDAPVSLARLAERYHALVSVCQPAGVRPLMEIWGFSATLRTLGEALQVAALSAVDRPAILADVYHLIRGGSPPAGLALLAGDASPVFHMNDVPAGTPPDRLTDPQRVLPSDGSAPLDRMVADLLANGFNGVLSLELFRDDLWGMEPAELARAGSRRMAAILTRSRRMANSRS